MQNHVCMHILREHNSKIKKCAQRDLIKNPYTREEIEKQIVDAINFRESIGILLMTKNITII